MTTVSIVTPWLNASELTDMYAASVSGAQAVVIDNGSDWLQSERIEAMVDLIRGVYIRNVANLGFSTANNQGLARATGDIVVFMNNDVECRPGFVAQVIADVQDNALYGPSLLSKHGYEYLEGWCIAGRREVWDALGGWDDQYYTGLYWEDNDLCFRATKAGIGLVKTVWPVWHFNNYTTRLDFSRATAHANDNERLFLERIRTWPS
jgi:GT2 family glycosyltransferase